MSALVDFILARLDEDEATARRRFDNWRDRGGVLDLVDIPSPARVLLEVDAKRRIVDLHSGPQFRYPDKHLCVDSMTDDDQCETLRALAVVWSGHPGFDETWRP